MKVNVDFLRKWFFPFKRINPGRGDALDAERGQTLLRVAVTAAATLYVLAIHEPVDFTGDLPGWLILGSAYTIFSAALAWRVLRSSESPPTRRYLGNVGDTAAISYGMFSAGDAGIPLFVLYLWITLGNGFRYGVPALIVSTALSIGGFSIVVWSSPVWHAHPTLVIGVSLALLILPLYAGHLLGLLHSALNRVKEASAAKSQFLARMSHELRTPLNGIMGSTELLRGSRRLSPEERSLLDVIEDSVNVSLRQIDNVLDFSKLEAGKLILEQTNIDLHQLLNSSASMVRPTAAQKGIRFLVRIAPDVPFSLIGDGHHLREVLLNLLSNAVKFTERGSVWLEVTNKGESTGRVNVRFEIRDTGIGISPEALARIFESFTQEDTSMTRRYGGTGLGTTIAKQLVDLMGGRIGVDSAKGAGTVFWFEIPFGHHADVDAEKRQPVDGRILLLTQDANVVQSYHDVLAQQLTCVGSGDEAIALVGRAIRLGNAIHAVLVDNGFALAADGSHRCAELCEKAAAANVPVVLIADAPPVDESLREWGYSAVLPRIPSHALVFSVLHASPHRLFESDPKVVSVPPWMWGGREESERPRMLVADDNRTNLMITRRMLEQAGYGVDAVQAGDEALERLQAGGYRLAVLDMHMPGLDGPSVLRRYRLMRPRSRLPIIVLTANASIAAQHACAEAGADAYLAKPVTARQLLSEVKRLLDDTEIEVLPKAKDPRGAADANNGAQNAEDVLDLSVLAELDRIYSDQRELGLLVEEYEREGRELIERIAATCRTRNHAAYCDAVHALKSNAANVGARRLMDVCRIAGSVGLVEFIRDRERLMTELREAFTGSLAALREVAKTAPQEGRGKSLG